MQLNLITNDDQKHAENKLSKFYKDDFISAEKKKYLTKLDNNCGPYLGVETKDGSTHYLLDAASQIATMGLGFSPSVFMGAAHFQASWTNNPNNPHFKKLRHSFKDFLLRKTNWNEIDIRVCNSGAESNEMALGLAYEKRSNKNAKKVLAFEGSFHGRMLISLFSTWNKSKREPYQWPTLETTFAPYPELKDANITKTMPTGWLKFWDESIISNFQIPKDWYNDPELKDECDSLEFVRKQLLEGETFAIIIEPMQCEGGDRYSSNRFHSALLLMAKSFGVEVIHDEVQTGYHLGRDFFWHRQFQLKDNNGKQLNPDYVVCAKKAQVGLVLSPKKYNARQRIQKENFQVSSYIRGYLHALALDQSHSRILSIENTISQKLHHLQQKFSEHFNRARACGLSFAIDLNNKDHVQEFINRRFDHGLLFYPAGAKTLRFRLNTSFCEQDINFLFERLDAMADDIFNNRQTKIPTKVETKDRKSSSILKWQQAIIKKRFEKYNQVSSKNSLESIEQINEFINTLYPSLNLEIIEVGKGNFQDFQDSIEKIQVEIYEPTRQTEIKKFKECAYSEQGICFILKESGNIAGIAFSGVLKDHPLERGIRQDPDYFNPNSIYMIDTTITRDYQSKGLGRLLKYALTLMALNKGLDNIKGRNRDQLAASMLNINLSLGSYQQNHLKEDYPDFETYRDVIYYSTELKWPHAHAQSTTLGNRINGQNLLTDFDINSIYKLIAPLTNKVCLSNFVSENFLQNIKDISTHFPKKLQHIYTASGQSEACDKILKSLLYNNKEKFDSSPYLLTFENHYFGEGSFLARSLSQASSYFPTVKLSRPDKNNFNKVLESIKKECDSKNITSIWVEPVCQLDFHHTPKEFLIELRKFCSNQNITLIYNETASQQFCYNDDSYFCSAIDEITPDASLVFLGGQASICALNSQLFVKKPLMMISTWDGDEFSFASYHLGMNKILANKDDFIKTRDLFHTKITKELEDFSCTSHNINKGRGSVNGALTSHLKYVLRKSSRGHYILDPVYQAMKDYLRSD